MARKAEVGGTPRPSFGDHLRVAWLFVKTVAGGIPFLVYLPLAPILTPWLRARARRRFSDAAAGAKDLGKLVTMPALDEAACAGKTVFVVAGEASGDALAAAVVAEMRKACPDTVVRGYGGPACAEAGVALDRDITSHAVFGFFGVVWSLGTWWKLCAETLARFREDPPDLLLTVDFPGLNVRLAGWAHARGIRTVHLVAPQLWAHTPWRILRWRAAVDRILATFPFEPPLFERSGIPTTFVGHPLFEAPLAAPRGDPAVTSEDACIVEIWPGSRRRELRRHAAVMVEAAADIEQRVPDAQFVVRLAHEEHRALFAEGERAADRKPSRLTCVTEAPDSDLPVLGAVASSGTATAQLAVDLVPMTVAYRVGFVEWCFAQALVTAPWICLANLILGRGAVPERVCFTRAAGRKIAADFVGVLDDRERVCRDLQEVRARLEWPEVAERAAKAVLAALAPRN